VTAIGLRDEIVDSLRQGDHRGTVSTLRAAVGLVALHVRAVLPAAREPRPPAGQLVLVVANPVGHGAELAAAARRAATDAGLTVVTVADRRLAAPALRVDSDFPGLGVRSITRVVRLRSLAWAWTVLAHRDAWPGARTENPVVHAYLVLAQAVRYRVADERVRDDGGACAYLVDFDRHAFGRPWCWAVVQHGRPLATLVHGSPSAATYLPFVAEHVLVWGDVQRDFVARAGADPVVVGRPELGDAVPPSAVRRCIVCHSMEDLTQTETERLGAELARLRAQGYVPVLKAHPRNVGARLQGAGWAIVERATDARLDPRAQLQDVLGADDVVLAVTSTAAVDALALGVTALVLSDADRPVSCDLEAIREWSTPAESGRASAEVEGLRGSIVAATGAEAALRLGRALRDLVATVPGGRG
jgi:hypothetical protein